MVTVTAVSPVMLKLRTCTQEQCDREQSLHTPHSPFLVCAPRASSLIPHPSERRELKSRLVPGTERSLLSPGSQAGPAPSVARGEEPYKHERITLLFQIFSKKPSLFCPINHKVLPTLQTSPLPPNPQPALLLSILSLDFRNSHLHGLSFSCPVSTAQHALLSLKPAWLTVIYLKKGKYLGSKHHIYHLLSNSLGKKQQHTLIGAICSYISCIYMHIYSDTYTLLIYYTYNA